MKGTRFAVIAVVSLLLVGGLLVASYTKGASPSAAAHLRSNDEKARQEKLPATGYARFQPPMVIAPSSL